MKWRGILLSKGAQMTLTKAELADMLFEKVGLNKREAKDMVETFFEEIRLALENGESVKLSGFGNFQLRDKPQRPIRELLYEQGFTISGARNRLGESLSAASARSAPPSGASARAAEARGVNVSALKQELKNVIEILR